MNTTTGLGLPALNVKNLLERHDVIDAELLPTASHLYQLKTNISASSPWRPVYAGTPVVAVRPGNPLRPYTDSKTGFCAEPTAESFVKPLLLLQDPDKTQAMGKAARKHVKDTFGKDRLKKE
jgi:glycosyltransferase involved in cell wall biosynthesis